MEKLFYFVVVESYDCLIGYRSKTKGFATLIEAWLFYKSKSKFDFDYGDSYQATRKPRRAKDADAYVLPKQRPHARSKEVYESWSAPYKCDPFLGLFETCSFDNISDAEVRDIEVTEKKEEEYFFDNGELLF
jgi:hypothetical protein